MGNLLIVVVSALCHERGKSFWRAWHLQTKWDSLCFTFYGGMILTNFLDFKLSIDNVSLLLVTQICSFPHLRSLLPSVDDKSKQGVLVPKRVIFFVRFREWLFSEKLIVCIRLYFGYQTDHLDFCMKIKVDSFMVCWRVTYLMPGFR